MKSRTVLAEIALFLLWSTDKLMQPTFRNLSRSFEGWERSCDLARALRRAQDQGLLEAQKHATELVLQLTAHGHERLRGPDPRPAWRRPWDGRWRQVVFDLPTQPRASRMRLWRWLRANGFGYLQRSVWVHPHPIQAIDCGLEQFRQDVEIFLCLESRCAQGYTNQSIVTGAWDFAEINHRHASVLETAKLSGRQQAKLMANPEALAAWIRQERAAWRHALAADPLLPRALWPKGYRGEQAWRARCRTHTYWPARSCRAPATDQVAASRSAAEAVVA